MTKYLRLDRRGMCLLWGQAIRGRMVFKSPNSVLRELLLGGFAPEPEPEDVQIRVEDEVWNKMKTEAARAGMDVNHLGYREKDELLQTLIEEYCESHNDAAARSQGGLATRRQEERKGYSVPLGGTVKTEKEIIAELQSRELRLATNSTDVNRPLCRDERDRNVGWVTALRWVLDQPEWDQENGNDDGHAY